MRICFVSRRYFPAISGMSVYAANLLRELSALGHELTMVSQYRGDAAGAAVYGGGPPPEVPGVDVVGLEALGEQDGGDFERDVDAMVAVVLARGPFDLVHAQYGYPTGLAAMEAARRLGVPCVVSIQGGDGHWVGSCCDTHRDAMRLVIERSDAAVIGCDSFAAEVAERLDVDAGAMRIVPGAVDVARFAPHPVREGPVRLLYHGRVDRRKGILDLLAALEQVDGMELEVTGIGPDLEEARSRAGDGVRFHGAIPYADVPSVYGLADVFVSPTYAEGFSNTVLEAMASGLPVVAGRAVGVVDCLRDGETGLMHEPGDVDALAALLTRVRDDAPLRASLREAALEDVRAHYAWPVVAKAIDGIYSELVAAGPRADRDWTMPREKLPCRYRDAPHLL